MNRAATSDDIALEQLLRAIEDDPLWFGYSCGTEHLLDGLELPRTGVLLRDFMTKHCRTFNMHWWDTEKAHTPYDRVVHVRRWERTKYWFVETRYGRIKIYSEVQ